MPVGSLFKLPDASAMKPPPPDHARPQRRLLAAQDQPMDEGGRHHPAARRGRRRRPDRGRNGPSCSACASSAPFRPRPRPSSPRRTAATRSSSTAARMLPTRVKELTDGEGVTTVFDTVGKDTFEGIARVAEAARRAGRLRHRIGPFPPIDALQLAIQGSVYFTRPALADFIADPAERAELSGALVRPCRERAASRSRSTSAMRWRTRSRRIATSKQGRRPARRSS
jgi:hypothetical protein